MKRSLSHSLVGTLAVLLLVAVGCGGEDEGGSSNSNSNGNGSGITCDPFTNEGEPVTPETHDDPVPTLSGGELLDGTYVLTAWDQYAGSSNGSVHQETFVFAEGSWKHIGTKDGAVIVRAGTFSTSGSTLTLNAECPQTGSLVVQYTATPTSFAFTPPDDADRVQSYTKLD